MSHGSTARNTRTLPVKLSTSPPVQLSAPALAATLPRSPLLGLSRSPYARPQANRSEVSPPAPRPLLPPPPPQTAPAPDLRCFPLQVLPAACAAHSPNPQKSSSAA